MAAVDVSTEERCVLEKSRVRKMILESQEPLRVDKLSDRYKEKHKVELEFWKEEFNRLDAFLRYGCGATINGDIVSLSPVEPDASTCNNKRADRYKRPIHLTLILLLHCNAR